MFADDFKENSKLGVDITDLNTNTVCWIFMFVYMDRLDGLQWDTALVMYLAVGKYEIVTLKDKCCFFLKKNMHNNKICELMLFADLH
ncbi:hypothetical protein NPIL_354661 [Nephila pilipes]|uniref:BTB domain-containing protein n=1 Tax=Nephila pilipes TaxID=299642 RepID=A0A8X6TUJ7_NEPPI|nr:hypothetical protein NPIL_354661 [Nephila pilipes]